MPNHPAPPLVIDESERAELRALARAGRTEQRIATRARIVLRAADGRPNRAIADELSVSPMTILLWRRRFETQRLAGLRDAPRPGREPTYDRAARARVAIRCSVRPARASARSSARSDSSMTNGGAGWFGMSRSVDAPTCTVQHIPG